MKALKVGFFSIINLDFSTTLLKFSSNFSGRLLDKNTGAI